MNWVGVAVFGPIVLLCLGDPTILLELIAFVVLVYIPAWWLLEKALGHNKWNEENDRPNKKDPP